MGAVPHPRHIAEIDPDRPAFILYEDGLVIGYGELVARAARGANLLAGLGVVEGDTIAILMENNSRYPELLWAAKDSGLRYVAISNHLNAADAAYILADCHARALITSHAMADVAAEAVALLPHPPAALDDRWRAATLCRL